MIRVETMKTSIRSISIILLGIVFSLLLSALFLFDKSFDEAQLSFKQLTPVHQYTRQKTIEHVDFYPISFNQKNVTHFDYAQRLNQLAGTSVEADDSPVIDVIRNYAINPPVKEEYLLSNPDLYDYSGGQSAIVDNNLRFKENGFYIECCNTDGESNSTSLFFETVRKWNGLVMATDPLKFNKLLQKNRKASTMNACLSSTSRIEKVKIRNGETLTDVFCFPLHAIMLAIQRSSVDLFAFDIGGERELSILETLPFDKLNIEMMTVRFRGEIRHFKSDVQLYLESIGYGTVLKLIKETDDSVHHLVMRKKSSKLIETVFNTIGYVLLFVIVGSVILFYCTKFLRQNRSPV